MTSPIYKPVGGTLGYDKGKWNPVSVDESGRLAVRFEGIEELTREINLLREQVEKRNRPWWKRLFGVD